MKKVIKHYAIDSYLIVEDENVLEIISMEDAFFMDLDHSGKEVIFEPLYKNSLLAGCCDNVLNKLKT